MDFYRFYEFLLFLWNLWTSTLCPTSMDLYIVPNGDAFLWTSILCQSCMDLLVFIFFRTHTELMLRSVDFYFDPNTLEFLCISIFCQTKMDFYGLLLLYGIYGLPLYAQQVWTYTLCQMEMHFYVDFYFVPNMHGFICIYIFAEHKQNLCWRSVDFYFDPDTHGFKGILMFEHIFFSILRRAKNYVKHGICIYYGHCTGRN